MPDISKSSTIPLPSWDSSVRRPTLAARPSQLGAATSAAAAEITYKIADCRREWQGAYRLVYDAYTAAGFMPTNPYQMRVTPWHLLPVTDVFIAEQDGRVIYTMTLIRDASPGLPLESVYATEVKERRNQGMALAEVSCLAASQDYLPPSRMFDVFVRLVSLMFQSCRARGVERLLIAIHPRHARFYNLWLGFDQIGHVKAYASVCGNPAVACEHDFQRLDVDQYRLYQRIYEHCSPLGDLQGRPMSQADRIFFEPVALDQRGHSRASAA